MQIALLRKYGGMVPRYTSYPTAPHFHDGINDDVYRAWLGKMDEGENLSLYFHVPFCAKMCWFCGCHTKIVNRYDPVKDYAGLLLQEIDLLSEVMAKGPQVRHVHWGGGTPTILASDDFRRIMDQAQGVFDFAEDSEIAVEIDPRTLDQDKAKALAKAGVNRASLGIQDFNETVQQAINRVQPKDVTARVIDWLRDAGIKAINFDLMYGLPHQTSADAIKSVDEAVSLNPDRLSLFGYAHVPWMKTHMQMIKDDDLPGDEARLDQAESTAERLQFHGYKRIGLDHFAKTGDDLVKALEAGTLQRNFQGYTNDTAGSLIGIGASSIGRLEQGYVQNCPSIREYRRALEAGKLPVKKGVELTTDDKNRRLIIERLMCDLTVDVGPGYEDELNNLRPMKNDGVVEISGTTITVTETGRPLVRSVCAVFDTYLNKNKARHSKAV